MTADQKLKLCLVEILGRLQCSAHSVDSASEATAVLLDLNLPRIILIDSALPNSSGIDLAMEVKHRPKLGQTWVVLLCRDVNLSSIAGAAQAGVDDLLLYPVRDLANRSNRLQEFESSLEANLQVRLAVPFVFRSFAEAQVRRASAHLAHDQLTGLWNRESLLSV